MLHEADLAAAVSAVHRVDLRDGDVALVDNKEEVLGEVVQQAEGALARLAPIEVAGIVLNARAVAQLAYHLQVVGGALVEPLGLIGLILGLQLRHTRAEVDVYLPHSGIDLLLGRDEEVGRMDHQTRQRAVLAPTDGVEGSDTLDLSVPEGHAVGDPVEAFDRGEDVHRIPLDAEVARLEGDAVIDIVVEHEVPLELL